MVEYLLSGSGCRAATTPPRLRGAEAASAPINSSTRVTAMLDVRRVASAAQARAAAERLARSFRFAASLCAAERGATCRSATSSTTLNRYRDTRSKSGSRRVAAESVPSLPGPIAIEFRSTDFSPLHSSPPKTAGSGLKSALLSCHNTLHSIAVLPGLLLHPLHI